MTKTLRLRLQKKRDSYYKQNKLRNKKRSKKMKQWNIDSLCKKRSSRRKKMISRVSHCCVETTGVWRP